MADQNQIPALLALASDAAQLQSAQHIAARKLLDFDGEVYPSHGYAITLSILLQEAGILISDTFQAISLGNLLRESRSWTIVNAGNQKMGDIGSTCGSQAQHGTDHVYLVLQALNPDEMVVADNQSTQPHFRFVSGNGGKVPTRFFLRAPG